MFAPSASSSSGGGGAGPAAAQHMHHLTAKMQPWVEKYRPHGVEDIAHQDEAVKTLKSAIQTVGWGGVWGFGGRRTEGGGRSCIHAPLNPPPCMPRPHQTHTQGTLPHLLFYGPPGTGKTSTILAVARALFGPEYR